MDSNNILSFFLEEHLLLSLGAIFILFAGMQEISLLDKINLRPNAKRSSMIVFVGLGLIVFDVFRPGTSSDNVSAKEEKKVRNHMQAYYQQTELHDFSLVEEYYAPVLDRFYESSDVLRSKVRSRIENFWATIEADKHHIDWDSWEHKKDRAGNHIISFSMEYICKKKTGEVSTSEVDVLIRLNPKLKVYYINNL